MFHYGLLVGLSVLLALGSGQWWLVPLAIGTELFSVSVHSRRHHPKSQLAKSGWRDLGLLIAVGTAFAWRFSDPVAWATFKQLFGS